MNRARLEGNLQMDGGKHRLAAPFFRRMLRKATVNHGKKKYVRNESVRCPVGGQAIYAQFFCTYYVRAIWREPALSLLLPPSHTHIIRRQWRFSVPWPPWPCCIIVTTLSPRGAWRERGERERERERGRRSNFAALLLRPAAAWQTLFQQLSAQFQTRVTCTCIFFYS